VFVKLAMLVLELLTILIAQNVQFQIAFHMNCTHVTVFNVKTCIMSTIKFVLIVQIHSAKIQMEKHVLVYYVFQGIFHNKVFVKIATIHPVFPLKPNANAPTVMNDMKSPHPTNATPVKTQTAQPTHPTPANVPPAR